jgi:hypothetical protein
MQFTVRDAIPFPRDQVFEAQRDKLPELAPYLHDIESITVTSREEHGAVSKLVNIWKAKGGDIPSAMRAFVKPEMLQWTDYASWDRDAWRCDWNLVLGFLPGVIECKGSTSFAEAGGRTTVTVAGDLKIFADKIPGVPRFMAAKAGETVEKFVIGMVKPNLSKTNEGVTAYLRAQAG